MAELTNDSIADLIIDAIAVSQFAQDGSVFVAYNAGSTQVDSTGPFLQLRYPLDEQGPQVFRNALAALGFGFYHVMDEDNEGLTLAAAYVPGHGAYPKFKAEIEGLFRGIVEIFAGNSSYCDKSAARIIVEAAGRRTLWKVALKIYAPEIVDAIVSVLTSANLELISREDQAGAYVFLQ